ncbi:MAG: phosphoribosylformylglycinamidine synthase subunit PurS [Cyanobacteria bacterium J06648_11]
MEYSAKIVIGLRPSVLDPAGTAVESSLHQLGYEDVQHVRIGKHVTLTLQADSEAEAEQKVRRMCDQLLANPTIEIYQMTLQQMATA